MTATSDDADRPAELDLYDADAGASDALVCRVCGALVSSSGDYPRVHWAWHEASNGA